MEISGVIFRPQGSKDVLVIRHGPGLCLGVPVLAHGGVKKSTDAYEQHQNQYKPYFAFFHKYLFTALAIAADGGKPSAAII